jgi:hypothetical protein
LADAASLTPTIRSTVIERTSPRVSPARAIAARPATTHRPVEIASARPGPTVGIRAISATNHNAMPQIG